MKKRIIFLLFGTLATTLQGQTTCHDIKYEHAIQYSPSNPFPETKYTDIRRDGDTLTFIAQWHLYPAGNHHRRILCEAVFGCALIVLAGI